MNLMMLLEMAASGFGERTLLRSGGQSLSAEQLFRAAEAAAAEIAASGCERVALLDVNSPALPVALFASAWAGVPFAPLNYRLTEPELKALVERVAPVYVVADAERAASLAGWPGVTAVDRAGFLARAFAGREPASGPAPEPPLEPGWPMDPDAIAVLLFTSGTTGAPKAAVLRHKHLVSYVLGSVEFGGAGEDEAALVSVPPYHVAGIAAIASGVYAGRCMVQLESFEAGAWIDAARRDRVTHAFVVPTMLARIVERLEADGAAPAGPLPLRALAYGGGKMPLAVIERALQLFPATDFTNAYGLTETSSTIALLGPDDHRAAAASADPAVRRRLASVGRPLPSVEVAICDAEGKPLPPGQHGEVYVRGEQVSGEYLGRAATIGPDGWFATRDAGWLDDDGCLFLEGRIDDVIVRGGENVSPGEIEDVLLAHDAVAAAAVVGVPDDQWGEAIAAVVVLREGRAATADELQDWVRARLRSSRMPARVEFRSELPYNEMGKLLRRRLRDDLASDTH